MRVSSRQWPAVALLGLLIAPACCLVRGPSRTDMGVMPCQGVACHRDAALPEARGFPRGAGPSAHQPAAAQALPTPLQPNALLARLRLASRACNHTAVAFSIVPSSLRPPPGCRRRTLGAETANTSLPAAPALSALMGSTRTLGTTGRRRARHAGDRLTRAARGRAQLGVRLQGTSLKSSSCRRLCAALPLPAPLSCALAARPMRARAAGSEHSWDACPGCRTAFLMVKLGMPS